ncbi:MAG TPA: ATPase, T2SS/T4P/T4SS family [Acidimicrobiales bacterium]|nr:ATPase, T2SS/T4P/T4SS family [Acidimicrobiales bacterium]
MTTTSDEGVGTASTSERDQLGGLLLDRGLVTEEQLDAAAAEAAQSGHAIGRILIEGKIVTESQLVEAIAAGIGMEFVDLAEYPIDPVAVAAIPEALARRYQAMPIAWDEKVLIVAMADPSNVLAVDDIRSVAKAEVRTVVTTLVALHEAIDKHHRLDAELEDVGGMAIDEADDAGDLAQLKEVTEDAPIVKLANLLIRQAVQDRASDIHIEPTERDVRIRYRIDGVLHEVMRSPKRVQAGLISRVKIMADLNIAERRLPQDGRISTTMGGRQVDLRVATLPTVYGEKIVMRILDKSTALLALPELGFLPQTLKRYQSVFTKPYGTILVTGPTGSGKSTTLYATLNVLSDPTKNVITVEDPVEYRLAGINQVQVNPKAGLTFASALRTILRADPDVVLVGEIRDRETASIAMEAALTGHLVLSTLHTNDACSTPTRLVEMGLEPYLVSSAIDCVVAQRLIRRLCERCKERYTPGAGDITALGWDIEGGQLPAELHRPVGCGTCGKTGYVGRFALHEVLLVTEEIETLIAERAASDDIKKVSVSEGMLTLRQAGLEHVASGQTSVEELLRVVA